MYANHTILHSAPTEPKRLKRLALPLCLHGKLIVLNIKSSANIVVLFDILMFLIQAKSTVHFKVPMFV